VASSWCSLYSTIKMIHGPINIRLTSKYFKELIFKTLLFALDQFIISDTEENLQKVVYYIVYLKNII